MTDVNDVNKSLSNWKICFMEVMESAFQKEHCLNETSCMIKTSLELCGKEIVSIEGPGRRTTQTICQGTS